MRCFERIENENNCLKQYHARTYTCPFVVNTDVYYPLGMIFAIHSRFASNVLQDTTIFDRLLMPHKNNCTVPVSGYNNRTQQVHVCLTFERCEVALYKDSAEPGPGLHRISPAMWNSRRRRETKCCGAVTGSGPNWNTKITMCSMSWVPQKQTRVVVTAVSTQQSQQKSRQKSPWDIVNSGSHYVYFMLAPNKDMQKLTLLKLYMVAKRTWETALCRRPPSTPRRCQIRPAPTSLWSK